MPSTPFNTPRGHTDRDLVRDLGTGAPYVASAHRGTNHNAAATPLRVGGGFDTTQLLHGVLSEEDRLATEWRAMEYRGNSLAKGNNNDNVVAQPYNETLEHFLAERKSNRLAANSFLAKDARTAATLSGTEVFEFSKIDTRRQFVSSPGGVGGGASRHVSPGAASSSGRQKSRLLGKLGLPSQPYYSSAVHSNLSSRLNGPPSSSMPIYAPHTNFQPLNVSITPTANTVGASSASNTSISGGGGALVAVNTSYQQGSQHQAFLQQHGGGGGNNNNSSNYHVVNTSQVVEPVASPIRAYRDDEHNNQQYDSSGMVDLTRPTASSQGKLRSIREKEIADAKLFSERYVSQHYDAATRDPKADGAIAANNSSFYNQHQHHQHFNPSANTTTTFAAASTAVDVTGNNLAGNAQGQGENYAVTNSSMLRVLKNSSHLVNRVVERSGMNLSCCGGGGKAPPAAGTSVNGLFTTYCQNSVHVQLENARRRLEMEEGARRLDEDVANERITNLMVENHRQATELQELKQTMATNEARFKAEANDLVALKDEYGSKFRQANQRLESVLGEKKTDEAAISRLERDLSTRNTTISDLERTVRDLRTNLAAAEAQVRESAKYTTIAHQDKIRAEAEAKESENQLSFFKEKMKTKDQLLRGSETTLKFVEGKLAATHHINSRQSSPRIGGGSRPQSPRVGGGGGWK